MFHSHIPVCIAVLRIISFSLMEGTAETRCDDALGVQRLHRADLDRRIREYTELVHKLSGDKKILFAVKKCQNLSFKLNI